MPFALEPPVFRPPSEADSLILQVTVGCSHNRCTFCSMYRSKQFRAKTLEQVRAEILEARAESGRDVRRVFLADGDAMCLSASRLAAILDALNDAFPRLQRVGIYANARDVLSKSDDELADLRQRGLKILYTGLESGDDQTLAAVEKGATAAEIVEAVRRARAAGMATSVMVLVGLAGVERSLEHARRSAEAINAMAPNYTALLTYTPTPHSPLAGASPSAKSSCPRLASRSSRSASSWPPSRARPISPATTPATTCRSPAACRGRKPPSSRRSTPRSRGTSQLKPEFLRGL